MTQANYFKRKNFWLVLAVIAALLYFNDNKLNSITRTGLAMNTVIRITLESKNFNKSELNKILDDAFSYINLLESQVSLYDAGSQVNKINNMAGIAPVEVSSDVMALALKSIEINKLTHNIFNPLIGPLTKLWKINDSNEKPELKAIDGALKLLDINIISVDLDLNKIYLSKAGAVLDFSGIAKGYASRRLADKFADLKIERALIDLGGNIQVIGSGWNIGIREPLDKKNIALKIKADDTAVITSGNYERYKIIDGIKYSHFFDPRTGMPVKNNMLSATLITPDGALADALATSFMIMGYDEALKFLESHKDLRAVLIVQDEASNKKFKIFKNF